MNGLTWRVLMVDADDPILVDRTGSMTIAVTDPPGLAVCVSRDVQHEMVERVLIHELGHCAMYSYGLIEDIHRMCLPSCWVEAEEWVCNFLADYGLQIFSSVHDILGDGALGYVSSQLCTICGR